MEESSQNKVLEVEYEKRPEVATNLQWNCCTVLLYNSNSDPQSGTAKLRSTENKEN